MEMQKQHLQLLIPLAGSGSFSGAGVNHATNMYQNVGTGAQGLTSGNYTQHCLY